MPTTVRCTLKNHAYVNEVQTVAQVFFPNSRFDFNHHAADDDSVHITSQMVSGEATAEVRQNGALLAAHTTRPQTHISEKRAVMLSLFHALKQVYDTPTPWGSLTGIRPSKLARQWLDEGRADDDIISTLISPFCVSEDKARLAVQVAHAEKRLSQSIKGIGLYVSVPFCPSRCLYCSFNCSTAHQTDHEDYVATLIKECKTKALPGNITSVYIGGGTPTVLSESLLYKLLEAVAGLASPAEFTVEAGRPDSLTPQKLRLLRDFGANRIAVNPQTLNDPTLRLIGRSHTAACFFKAYEMAQAAGFTCINTDIIVGLPSEGTKDMEATLAGLMPLRPQNITVHTLAVKRASRLNERLSHYAADASQAAAMLDMAHQACRQAGYVPYYLYRQKNMAGLLENVGYSRPGFECLYNVGMMAETQTIIGLGAAAVCKYIDGTKITRTFNPKNPQVYIQRMVNHADAST